ncbi:LOW QUALITY PROTEIN: polycystin-1-like [Branchiostoma floridae]|uniref:LOW QUALITY PROTEIN: polycystin-1-like n=1 Tax=Branchiostoma floridae TaxID=7739 RepID=A0A9J7N6R0_BRAFL|nr:LOW QUALITY PROTEIN: polycystin-1-like [Branchiostoma floridae]
MQPDVLVTGKHGVLRPRLYWIYLLCGLLACVGPWPALGHTTEAPTTEGPTKTNCETPCPDKCLCSAVPKACTVDCTGQGLRQVPSPTGLPIPTKKLILSENNVSTIAEDAFKSLQNLEELIMDRNNISSLPNRVFNNLSSLKILNLTYNCLESLEVNSFEGLTSLEELLLQGNKLNSVPDDLFADSSAIAVLSFRENLLTTLPENVFQNLTSLQELDLSKNRLTSMSKQLFTGLHMLHTLDLSSNELDNLTYGVFDDLVASNSSLTSLSLGSNPYQCTCDLFWLPLWLTVATGANITLPDQPNITCVDPQTNTVKHVDQVDFSPLNCKPCKLSAGLLAILRKHRHSKVHWHEKHSLSRHRSSRGRRNAQSYGACYTDTDTGEESLVFFQYEQSGSHDTASCNAICYAQGYSYGGLPDAQDTCYCGELAESFPFYTGCKLLWCEWDHTISISIQQSVCQGHLGIPSSFKTFPTFHISNTRTYYSINEDIDFTLAGILTDSTKSYVWDLGDGSPQVNKTGLSINHKYSVDGTYTLLVEGLYNGTVVTTWMSVVIVTPITGVTLTCPPSHYTGSDAFSVTLEAQTGYNISVQWLVSDYHVEGFITDEPDADYRQYYMVGSVVFDSVDIPAVNMTAQAGVASANTKRLLLFPGMWFQHTGLLSTWEFVAAPGVSNIHLQVYRPTCPGFGSYLLPPGCQSLPSPYATCVSGQLCNATDSCPAGQQYCYLSSSCQAITEPCSEYAMMNQALPPRYINAQPNYTLAGETNLHISVTERTLVRVDISQQPITVYQDDIIGVQFDSKDALQYYNSSTSEWVQSALYMEQDDWVQMWTQPEEYSDTWFDDALFEIRAMYTVSETFSYSPSNADIIKARPVGTVTFAAIVENPVTQRTARNCTITFEDAIEGAELIYPIPGDDGIIRLETGKEYNFVVMITKGTDVSATFIFWSEVHAGIPVQDTCPDDMEDVPQECTPTSNTTSYAFYSKQYDSSTNQFHLSVQLTNLVTQVTATSTVQVDEVISGVTISSSSPRTAEGIEQTFTVSYATGTSVNSYEWYIDDSVVLNADSSSFFHTFSEASTHTIYVVIENPHGAANATLDITIDQMEAMQDLMFVNAPALEAAGDAVTFTATAAVDSYYDYTWQWDYGDGHSDTISSSAPYTGDTPIANTYLVQHGESINHTFANPGIYTVNVLVFNNYGNISAQHTVEIRPKLTGVSVTAEPVAVERGEPVTLTATPHGATEDVTYKWNYDDSSTDEGSSNVSIHTYTVAATYNVSVTADNGVSKAASFVLVKAQVKVTGLELSTDPEVTEMNEVTTLTATVQTGTDLLYNSDMGDGFVLYNLTSPFVHTYTYPGNYTANVTAFNDISSEWETITVMVISSFTIDNVTSGSCTELGKMTTFEASITTDNIDILQFTWYFGDGNATTVLGSPIITHRYGTTGNFTVRLKVENTQKVLWETIYGCVQEPISGVYVTASGPTALGHETTVNVVLGTGSHYVYRVDFGDGVLETYDGGSDVKHVYGSAGSYNVTVTVENEVTTTTVTTTARVVEEISGISITHNGTNQDFVRSQSLYTYQANVARGTEVDYTWNFGYDQEIVSGEIQTYQYDVSGIYIVTVNASNDVSSSSNSEIITVQDTVDGTREQQGNRDLGGVFIFFDADITAGTDPKYTWKLCSTCSSFVGSDSITRPFDAVGTFEVSVNVANEVSSEEVSTSVTVIYPVKGAQISGDLTAGSLHAAGQAYTFSASVSEGSADHYQWEVSKYGSHISTFTGSEVHITFPDYGQYDVSVVVSNSVSDSEASMTVDVIELVTDVDLTASKTMASNEDEVTFTAASTGTNLTFVWSLGDGSPNIETTEPQVQHQYNLAGTFLVTVNVSNDLSSLKSTSLPVEILEKISGLDLETTTTDTNYYAGQNEFTNFVATLTSGSNVTYSWRFTDGGRETSFNGLDLDEAKMVYNMLGNQTASLSADNDVSHQNITRTIVVQKRPTVVTLWPNASYVETLDVISITQQVEGTDLEYELDFGDGQQMIGDSLPSTILHSYSKTGTYALSLTVKNFVGQEEYVVSITVLQRIEGLAINTNCIMPYCTNGFLSLGEELEYAAKWVQGNNITFTWVVVQADGSTIGSTGETMTFAPTQLGSQSVTLRAENWLNSVSVAETFTVQEEIVSATLTTSNIINLYENATVSFHMGISSGSDVYYEWDFNDGFSIFETSVSDQNRTFPTAGDYLVRVKAFNNISLVVKEIAITIRELMCQEPTVDRVGLFSKEVLRSSEAFLEVDVNTFDCTKYRVIHQWTVYQGSQCGVNNITLPSSVNRASTRLILPKQTLGYDLYCIEYQIVYQDTPVLSVVRFSLRVKASPLTPLIKGGTERTQSSTQELLLDGTSSFDPDTPDKTGLTFQWNCQAYTTQNGPNDPTAACNVIDWATLQHKSLVSIPANTLPEGTTFLLNLTVGKQDRVPQSAQQTIVVNVQNVPSVFITCVSCISLNTMTISWNQHVTVTGECQNCNPDAVYKWDVRADDNSVFELNEYTTTTGDSSRNLVLRPGALASGHGYTFTLTVTDGSQHGYATLHLDHNDPPSGGLCTVSASEAKIIASYTTVTFDCSGWNDNNNIYADLLINIIVMRQTGQHTYESFLLYRGTQTTYQSTLPVGLDDWNHNVRVVILVEDRLGAQAEAFNSTMTVEYPEKTDLNGFDTVVQWLSNRTSTDLQNAEQNGNTQLILGLALISATILNVRSEEAWASNANDGEFSDRENLRSDIINTVTSLSGSISTKEDSKQVSAVLSLCTMFPPEMISETSHHGITSALEDLVQIQEEEAEEGQVVDMDTATNIMNIISNLMDAANLNIYEPTTDISVSFSESHRREVVTNTYSLASRYNYALLKSKVEGEEDIVITAPSISSRAKLTQASVVSTAQNISGSQFVVPRSVLGVSSEVVSQVEMVFDTNPFTWGHQHHISSQMMSLQFARSDQTEVSVDNLPEESQIKAFMVEGGLRNTIIGGSLVGSPGYDPSEGLDTTDGTIKGGGAINVIVNITDCRSALHIQVRYNETVAGSTEEDQSVTAVYVGTNNRTLVLTQALMTGDHRDYTMFFPPSEHAGMSQVNLTITNNYQKQDVQVSVGLYCSSCLYYNQDTGEWDDAGLTASAESTATVSVCYTSHLTSFGAVVLLPPNAITLEDFPTLEDIAQNPVALITCMCWLAVFLVAGFVVRKLDLRDIRKVAVVPLCGRDGPYKYEISVMTGMTRNSGTTAHVGVNIFGSNGKKSGRRVLLKPNAFLRNSTDVFQIAVDGSLGDIIKIKIWHDNTGLDPSWNLKSLVVHDIQTDKRYHFLANSWFSLEEPDGFVEKDVYVASPDALKKFSTVFKNETARGLSEQHLWLSVLERPARNRFTRVQRVTCLATLVYSFMCVNAMWYGLIKTNTEDVEIWYFAFSWEELAVGIISNLMVFPINLLIVTLFRKIKSKVKATDYYEPVAQRAQTAQTIEMDVMCATSQNGESLITMSGQSDPFALSFDPRTGSMKHSQSFRHGGLLDDDDDSDDEAEYRPRGGKMSMVDSWEDLRKDKRSLENRNKLWSYESIMNWSDTEQAPSKTKKSQLKRKKTGRYGNGKDIPGIHVDAVLSDDDDDDSWGKTAPTPKIKKSGNFLSTKTQADGKMSRTHSVDDLLTSDEFWSSIMDETSDQKDSSRTLQSSGSFTPRSDADLDSGIGDPIHKTLEPSIHSESDQSQQTQTFLLESDTTSLDSSVPPQRRRTGRPASSSSVESLDEEKGKWLLPYWFVYIAYLLCAIIIAGCMVVIIMYGQAFGRDQATKWVLSMFLSLIQSMFLMEPIRVILIALFLASISKPTNHDDEDDLVDRPVVENQDDRTKSKAIRAPYGYGLLQAREEARKVRVMYTIIHQCIFYLLFILTILIIAFNDNDLNTYRMTHSIEDSLVKPEFGTSNRSFLTITQSEDWWEYMDSVLLPTLLDTSQGPIRDSSLEGVVLGGVRLRQIRNTPETCMLQGLNRYPNLWTSDWECYYNVRLSTEDSSSYGETWTASQANQANWTYSETNSYNGLMYYGRDGSYSDNGYILDLPRSYNASITALAALNSSDWIDRGTRAVFVEFSLYNPNVNLFSVVTLLLELPVTGVGRASRDIKSGRFVVYGYGVDLLMIMQGLFALFLLYYIVVECCQLKRHGFKSYLKRFQTYYEWTIIIISTSSLAVYIHRLMYTTGLWREHLADKTKFISFFHSAYLGQVTAYLNGLVIFLLMIKVARQMRFRRQFSIFGKALRLVTWELAGCFLIFFILILTYAQLGYLLFSNHSPYFTNMWMSITAMVAMFRGQVDLDPCREAQPFLAFLFFTSYILVVFCIVGRLFGAILIHGFTAVRKEMHRPAVERQDYEMVEFMIKRFKMWTGLAKPKAWRHNVKFLGMDRLSTRSSRSTVTTPGGLSHISTPNSPISLESSGSVGLGHIPEVGQMDPNHLEYLLDRLTPTVDAVLSTFDRLRHYVDDDNTFDEEPIQPAQRSHQRTNISNETQQKRNINISRKDAQSAPAKSGRSSNRVLKASSSWTQGIPGQEKALPTQRENSWTKGSSTSGPPSRRDQSSAWRQNKEVSWADRYKDNAWGSSNWTRKGASDPWGDRRREDSWEQSHPRSTTNSPARKKEHSWSSDYGSSRRQGSRGSVPQRPTPKKPAW